MGPIERGSLRARQDKIAGWQVPFAPWPDRPEAQSRIGFQPVSCVGFRPVYVRLERDRRIVEVVDFAGYPQ